MTGDRPLLGIALMLGFCVLAPVADAVAKLIGAGMPLLQVVAARFVIQAAVLVPVAARGRGLRLPPGVWRLVAARTALHIAGIGTMFLALRHLPLADALAIAYVMPFVLLVLGRAFLAEEIGLRRVAACAVGFAGTLMVVQPRFAEVGAPALLPLAVAVIFAAFMLVTRQMSRAVDAVSMQAVSGLMASAVLVPALVLAQGSGLAEFDPVAPDGRGWGLILALGLLGTLAHLLMTWSLRYAPAATLAPMQYLEIPVATLVGLAVFEDFPDGLALAGIALTMGAGLYIVLSERRISARSPR